MARTRCKLEGCSREHHAKGYCNKHYHKLRLYGDPLAGTFQDNEPYVRKSEAGIYRDRSNRKRSIQAAPDPKKQQPTAAADWIPEPKRERSAPGSQSNLSFFLNQPFIEKIYSEIRKADKEPLYKSSNFKLIDTMLELAAGLAGYNCKNGIVWEAYSKELLGWAKKHDKIRFMEALANWPQRVQQYTPKKPIQLSFDNMTSSKTSSR